MSDQRDKVEDEPNAVEVELLADDEDENYEGLTLKCALVYMVSR